MKKNLQPGKNKRIKQYVFENFNNGTIQDPPASEIVNALADSKNLTIFPAFYEGRTGCRKYTTEKLPSISGRSGYSAHKVGQNIISDSGAIFQADDVGNYFDFGDYAELIIQYNSPLNVIGSDEVYRSGTNCKFIGMPNAFFFHKLLKKWIVITYGEVFISSGITISEWINVLQISKTKIHTSRSDHSFYNYKTIIFSSTGMFKVDSDSTLPIAYKINVPPPSTRIEDQSTGTLCSYRYLYSAARFSEEGDRKTEGIIIDLETGTNKVDQEDIDYGTITTALEISSTNPVTVRTLWIPKVEGTEEYEWHLTHFPVWRTLNLENKDPGDVYKEKFNDPSRYVWVADVRVAAAFYGRITNGIFTAAKGTFKAEDAFSILELTNGERYEIVEVIDSKNVRFDNDYYNLNSGDTGAAIGYGEILEGVISNGILNLTVGTITASDVGKTLYSADEERFYITEYFTSTSCKVHLTVSRDFQSFTHSATHRNFCDTIDDITLYSRMDFYSCYSRFRTNLPDSNLGMLIPGFIVVATSGQSTVRYTHLTSETSQLMGQYCVRQTSSEIKDNIQMFWLFEGVLSIICSMSTYGISTGLSESMTLPGSTETISLIPGIKLVDKQRGTLDIDSACETEDGNLILITNEPGGEALRLFNGSSYSTENYLVDSTYGGRIVKEMSKTKRKSISIYDGFLGYVLWRTKK